MSFNYKHITNLFLKIFTKSKKLAYLILEVAHNKSDFLCNLRTVNITLTFSVISVLVSHTLFSVGLYDGTGDLFNIIHNNQFNYVEQSRTIFNTLYQIPSYLFIKFSAFSSLSLLTQVFSFGLIWVHIFSLVGCYFILPKNKKHLIFFSLFAFFIGPVISLSMSISVALSVCSYVWLVAYIIYYSDLSKRMHKFLLFAVPLPLLLSHELMSYMAWPLIFLCWNKNKIEKNILNRSLLWFVKIYLFVISVVQTFMIVEHDALTNAKGDLSNTLNEMKNLSFLFVPEFNFLLILSLLVCFYGFVQIYKDSIKYKFLKTTCELSVFLSIIFILIASFFQAQNHFMFHYGIRFYPPIVALPFSLLLWWICERKKFEIRKSTKVFLFSCVLFCLTLVFFRISIDYKFYKYQIQISEEVAKCEGVLDWKAIEKSFIKKRFNYKLLRWHEWQIFPISLLYPRSKVVKAVVMPSDLYYCVKHCRDSLHKSCSSKRCKDKLFHLFPKLTSQHNKKFFDTSEIMNNILNSTFECKN